MKALRSQLELQLTLLGVLALASCGGGSGGGTVVIPGGTPPAPPAPLQEIEPNDNALFADYIGEVLPGDFIEIEGHITECCPDPYDGFAFYASGPVELIITLREANLGADLDFCIYDPTIDQVVACWETDSHPEVGIFDFLGPGEFHIVLASYFGDSEYLLQVDVRALPLGLAAMAEDSAEVNRAPSPSATRRFGDYHPGLAAPGAGREALLIRHDEGETLLLPAGVLQGDGF